MTPELIVFAFSAIRAALYKEINPFSIASDLHRQWYGELAWFWEERRGIPVNINLSQACGATKQKSFTRFSDMLLAIIHDRMFLHQLLVEKERKLAKKRKEDEEDEESRRRGGKRAQREGRLALTEKEFRITNIDKELARQFEVVHHYYNDLTNDKTRPEEVRRYIRTHFAGETKE